MLRAGFMTIFKKKRFFSNEVLCTSQCAFFDVDDLEIFDIILK